MSRMIKDEISSKGALVTFLEVFCRFLNIWRAMRCSDLSDLSSIHFVISQGKRSFKYLYAL